MLKMGDIFLSYDEAPLRNSNNTMEMLMEYEKHYMRLVERHKNDISFINNLLRETRDEMQEYTIALGEINSKLDEQNVDETVKNIWLKHINENLYRSFELSTELIEHFVTKTQEQFKTELQKCLNK